MRFGWNSGFTFFICGVRFRTWYHKRSSVLFSRFTFILNFLVKRCGYGYFGVKAWRNNNLLVRSDPLVPLLFPYMYAMRKTDRAWVGDLLTAVEASWCQVRFRPIHMLDLNWWSHSDPFGSSLPCISLFSFQIYLVWLVFVPRLLWFLCISLVFSLVKVAQSFSSSCFLVLWLSDNCNWLGGFSSGWLRQVLLTEGDTAFILVVC